MRGYVARKGDRWYAVVYEGLDPVTVKEKRSWHPAGTSQVEAEQLAARLAAELNGRNDKVRSLTFGAYITNQWLPGKKINLAQSTWDGYRRKIDRHIFPAIGHLRIRRLRAHHLEKLYDRMLYPQRRPPTTGTQDCAGGAPHHPRRPQRRGDPGFGQPERGPGCARTEAEGDTEGRATGLDSSTVTGVSEAAAGHRLFPALWLLASAGMRRSELLGLRWDDVDFKKTRVSVNRGLVAVAYELRESRGKTPNSRRAIDLDPTTIRVQLRGITCGSTVLVGFGRSRVSESVHRGIRCRTARGGDMSEVAIFAVVIVLVALALGGVWFYQRRRSEALQTKFGPEYDRVVDEAESRLRGESELRHREKRIDGLDIRPLDPETRRAYQERWRRLQQHFVDDPPSAVGDADRLVIEIMRERAYPIEDFEQRSADLSVEHPEVVENYRRAHAIAVKQEKGHADTEDLREAVVAYRALVEELLEDKGSSRPIEEE